MFGITRLILNLSIGAKLGIASGLGVLLVATAGDRPDPG